jgi:hypothetical protein
VPTVNGNGRIWWDKWRGEIVRLLVILVVAFASSYWVSTQAQAAKYDKLLIAHEATNRQIEKTNDLLRVICSQFSLSRDGQRTALLVELSLAELLTDRQHAGLDPVPSQLRQRLLEAIANLPDMLLC